MTVLLTLLGAGLVVFFIWLSVVSWKSIKHRKNAELIHKSIWTHFDDMSNIIEETQEEIRKDFSAQSDELHRRIDELYQVIEKQVNELYSNGSSIEQNVYEDMGKNKRDLVENIQSLKTSLSKLESNVDSRFDKCHSIFGQNAVIIEELKQNMSTLNSCKCKHKKHK